MRHPVRRADQGWSLPGDRVCQAHPVGRATERDVLTRRWRGFGCDGDGGRIDDDGADELVTATQFVAGRVEHEVVETPRPTRRHRLGGWVRGRHGHSVPIWFERCWWSLMVIVAVNRLQDVNAFAAGFIHRR
jgi:hypothetical protein